MMTGVFDTNLGRGQQLAEVFAKSGVESFHFQTSSTSSTALSLLLLHNNDTEAWKQLGHDFPPLIIYFTGAFTVELVTQGTTWIHKSLGELSVPEARAILEWTQEKLEGKDIIPPFVLGGDANEGPLQMLHALFPFGLQWEATGAKSWRIDTSIIEETFEADIARRFSEHLNGELYDFDIDLWPEAPYPHGMLANEIRRRLNGQVEAMGQRWREVGCDSPPQSPDRVLQVLASSESAEQFMKRLEVLRDHILEKQTA